MSMKVTCGEFVGLAYASDDELREFAEEILAENAKLRELIQDYDECLDTALYLAGEAGYSCMPDEHLFKSLRPRMRELVVGE